MSGGFLTRVVPCRTVQLFTDKAEVVSEAVASFDWRKIQGINIHGVWIISWAESLGAVGEVRACVLWSQSSIHQGDLPSYLPLEMEVGSFLVPTSNGDGAVVHGLDSLHDSNGDSGQKIRDEGGGVFDFIVLSMDDVEFKLIDVLLELFSSGNVGGGKPVHGFLLNVGISKCFFKICFENGESPEGLVGKSLLAVDFSPHGSRPLLHIGQSIGNLPVVVVVEGLVDKEIEADRVQPGLGCFCFSIVFIGASNVNLSDPRTRGGGGRSSSRDGGGLV